MRSTFRSLQSLIVVTVAVGLSACGGVPPPLDQDVLEAETTLRAVQQHAAELSRAIERSPLPSAAQGGRQAGPVRQVQWLEPVQSMPVTAANSTPIPSKAFPGTLNPGPLASGPSGSPVNRSPVHRELPAPGGALEKGQRSAPISSPASTRSGSPQADMLAELLKFVQDQDELDLTRALMCATVLAAGHERTLDLLSLHDLSANQRELVMRYHHLVVRLREKLALGELTLGDELAVQLDTLVGPQPMRIREFELCRHVAGFGVYETLEQRSLLVGQDHKMIVYVELEHFQAIKNSRGRYEVKLGQEVVLYTDDSAGLAVWRQPRVEIVDESRNKRQDFFVVQMIRLPARLNVGKYRLKVTLDDLHGVTRAEAIVPLRIVAGDPQSLE